MSDPSTRPLPESVPEKTAEGAPRPEAADPSDQQAPVAAGAQTGPSCASARALSARTAQLDTAPLVDRLVPHNENTRPVGRYSRFVDLMKVLLPGLAAVVFVSIIAVTFLVHDDKNISVAIPSEPAKVQNELMETPELSGFDDKGRPYKVTAHTAQRDQAQEQLISLTDLKAWMVADLNQALDSDTPVDDQIDAAEGDEITVTSRTGLLNTQKQTLALKGDVVLTDRRSYRIETNAALVDMAHRNVKGRSPVHVTMDWGTVDANGFDAFDEQKKVVFKGNVKTIAY